MRRMANKGIFESKPGSRERRTIWQNITGHLNDWKFYSNGAKPLRSFYYTYEKAKSISQRQEVKDFGLKGEELSKNEQFLEDLIKRFEESERRTEADT